MGNNPINNLDPTGHYYDPGGNYHEISDDGYKDLAGEMGIEIKDTSPWKDIVDSALDDQYNNSGGGAGGGSSGGVGETRPPTLEEGQQLLNQAARPVTNSYNVSRGSVDRNQSGQIFRDQNQYHFYNNLLNNNDNGVRQWAQRQLDEGNYFVQPSSYTP